MADINGLVQYSKTHPESIYRKTRKWLLVDLISDASNFPGCYALVHAGQVLYLGQSSSIRERLRGHGWRIESGGVSTKWGFFDGATIKVRISGKADEHLLVEQRLLRRLRPRFNRFISGVRQARQPQKKVKAQEPAPVSTVTDAYDYGMSKAALRQEILMAMSEVFMSLAVRAQVTAERK